MRLNKKLLIFIFVMFNVINFAYSSNLQSVETNSVSRIIGSSADDIISQLDRDSIDIICI